MTVEQEEEDFLQKNYVARTLRNEPASPAISWSNWYKEVNWPQATLLCLEPFVALYGLFTTGFVWQTFLFRMNNLFIDLFSKYSPFSEISQLLENPILRLR